MFDKITIILARRVIKSLLFWHDVSLYNTANQNNSVINSAQNPVG